MSSRRHNKPKNAENRSKHVENRAEHSVADEHRKGQKPADCKCNQSEEPKPGPLWLFLQQDPVAGFTAWIALFTLCLMLVSGIQVWAFIQSERAFATMTAAHFRETLAPNKELSLMVEIGNSGRSSAFIDGFNITAMILPKDAGLPVLPNYLPGGIISVGPVLAAGKSIVRVDIHGIKGEQHLVLNDADVRAINDRTYKFYIFGYVSYLDDFSVIGHRVNGFCALYNPEGDASTSFDNCNDRAYTYSR